MIDAALPAGVHTVVLVEGESDRRCVETLAGRAGRDLRAEGVEVVAMDGITTVGRAFEMYGPGGLGVRLTGLCDRNEVRYVVRAWERIGVSAPASELGAFGFFVCDADLEEELIRALGVEGMLAFVDAQGEGASFKTLQQQPAQRGRPIEAQLRRFVGTRGGRKVRYAEAIAAELDLGRLPLPLRDLLAVL